MSIIPVKTEMRPVYLNFFNHCEQITIRKTVVSNRNINKNINKTSTSESMLPIKKNPGKKTVPKRLLRQFKQRVRRK